MKKNAVLFEKRPLCILEPPLEDLEATYAAHLRFIGKRVEDFLLVIIELCFDRFCGWGNRCECRQEVVVFKRVGQFGPKFQVEGVVPHQPFFVSWNQMHRSFVWCKNLGWLVFRFVRMHAFDRRTDGFTMANTVLVGPGWCKADRIYTTVTPDIISGPGRNPAIFSYLAPAGCETGFDHILMCLLYCLISLKNLYF